MCVPHPCICGEIVDKLGHHGLSCYRSAGRRARHEMINDLVKRALTSAEIPSIREPNGYYRKDNKRPDGITLIPWLCGKPLLWDVTCTDTLAKSYSVETTYGINSVISKLMTFVENAETGQFLFLIMLILSCFTCS
jgi:hypothetical protein